MDLENLTKAQLIMLTLLVSFVTSIATGIMTIALLGQTTDPVTRTINNVIERTIEKVVPGDSKPVTETPKVQSESELIQSAIAKNSKSLVRIYTGGDATTTDSSEKGTFRGLGVVVSSDGLVAVPDQIAVKGRTYVLQTGTGIKAAGTIVAEGRGAVALIKMTLPTTTTAVAAASLGKPAQLQLGQTLIALSGEVRDSASVETTASLVRKEGEGIEFIETSPGKDHIAGSPLFTVTGEVIGLFGSDGQYSVLSTEIITALQKPVTEKPKPTSTGESNSAGAANALPL